MMGRLEVFIRRDAAGVVVELAPARFGSIEEARRHVKHGLVQVESRPHDEQLSILERYRWMREECMDGVSFRGKNLNGADFRNAVMTDCDFREADLGTSCMRYGCFRRSDFRGASLKGADLHRADLRDADLRGASLLNVDLSTADLTGAKMDKEAS
jgi:uncharacterized protein YjbI with pentapeptide repeats